MSTPANIDFRAFGSEEINLERRHRGADGPQAGHKHYSVRTGHDDAGTRGGLTDTMSATVAPARSAASVADACDSARTFLEGLVHPISAEAADTVFRAVSEFPTNVLRHGSGTCALELTAHPDGIEVVVRDRSPQAPPVCTPGPQRRYRRLRLACGRPPRPRHRGHPSPVQWQDRQRLPPPRGAPAVLDDQDQDPDAHHRRTRPHLDPP